MAAGAQGTYPLDTLRLRMAVDPGARSMRGAAAALLREGSQGAFFRGLGTSLAGVACLHVTVTECMFDKPQTLKLPNEGGGPASDAMRERQPG